MRARFLLPSATLIAVGLLTGCSSRVERFDYDYGSTHPAYSRLGGPRPAAPTPPREGRSITVVGGDTLTAIARRHGVTVEDLRTANALTSDRLRVGQVIVVP